ncbi:MAG TPA: ROK family protein [Bryobacteraceae bacterium]|jgi:predicted NBD/HSP70 family sugar kinase|nr:ROK family protein [Bryobacteraceae bacterium]
MGRSIGVLATHYLWVGMVEGTNLGTVRMYPEPGQDEIDLKSVPVDDMIGRILEQVELLHEGEPVESVGAGFPGIVRCGIIDDSPNLAQLKGLNMQERLGTALKSAGIDAPVTVMNDADALAAGIAATQGVLEKLIRVWYLGDGIGYGRYPCNDNVCEGGHMVVSLDPKERFCGCGGLGHLEGIMGNRAMRLRFLDMEPEDVFAAARQGDTRAADFVKLWHRALAAATATNVHLEGPGRIYLSGPNCDFVDLNLLNMYLLDMVKMSPLQGTFFEIVHGFHDLALIGAAVHSREK